MSAQTLSSRRAFLKGGAILAAPLAVAAPAAAMAGDRSAERLAELEDVNALRDLHRELVRRINSGAHDEAAALFAEPGKAGLDATMRRVEADPLGDPDAMDFADGRAAATINVACTVRTETPIEGVHSSALDMARLQGGGFIPHTERRVLETACVKQDGVWKIARAEFRAA